MHRLNREGITFFLSHFLQRVIMLIYFDLSIGATPHFYRVIRTTFCWRIIPLWGPLVNRLPVCNHWEKCSESRDEKKLSRFLRQELMLVKWGHNHAISVGCKRNAQTLSKLRDGQCSFSCIFSGFRFQLFFFL